VDGLKAHLKLVLADSQRESFVRIISRAKPAEYPSLPNHMYNMGVSIIEGLFAGVVVATLVEFAFWYVPLTGLTARSDRSSPAPSDEY